MDEEKRISEEELLEDCEHTMIYDSVLVQPGMKEFTFNFSPHFEDKVDYEELYAFYDGCL